MDHTAARKRPSSARFHKYLPYLVHQAGYQRFRVTSSAQVCGALHRYIHTKMEFMDISSLGVAYRYVVKIEQKLKQKTRKFGPGNPSQQNPGKGGPNPQNKGQRKYG
jgi:hypothetical protein